MITNRAALAFFWQADIRSCGFERVTLKDWYLNPTLRFQRCLRLTEFYRNVSVSVGSRFLFFYHWNRLHRLRQRLGFTIPLNVFGPGLSLSHVGTIVVNRHAVVGANCRIHPGVCIGGLNGKSPRLGDNVYIGPGAKIFGAITVGDNVAIGANSVVNRDVPAGVTVAGSPAKIVSKKGSFDLIVPGTELAGQANPDWHKYRTAEALAGRFPETDGADQGPAAREEQQAAFDRRARTSQRNGHEEERRESQGAPGSYRWSWQGCARRDHSRASGL
jgi:serine O-acetyltransferase